MRKDTSTKIIAIHQPNYLPWLGYFFKIHLSDIFVFHDQVEYTKKSLTKRCYIRKDKATIEKKYLTIPLKMASDFSLIKDLEIDHTHNWRKKQLNQIQNLYQSAPHFAKLFPPIESFISSANNIDSLATFNIKGIALILDLLEMNCDLRQSSDLAISGKKTDYNIKIIKQLEADIYLSGQGAKKYQEESEFQQNDIQLLYHDLFNYLHENPYAQKQGNFLNGLSILDALFNIGTEGIKAIFDQYKIQLQQQYSF